TSSRPAAAGPPSSPARGTPAPLDCAWRPSGRRSPSTAWTCRTAGCSTASSAAPVATPRWPRRSTRSRRTPSSSRTARWARPGRRRPAVITGPRDAGTARLRLETFRAALAEHGLDLPDSRVLDGEFRSTGGYAAMAQAIDEEPPDAVFVANGSMGLGVLQLLSTHPEIRVPED